MTYCEKCAGECIASEPTDSPRRKAQELRDAEAAVGRAYMDDLERPTLVTAVNLKAACSALRALLTGAAI